jgi:glycosyltransferase involved in cell wall biosynthesis
MPAAPGTVLKMAAIPRVTVVVPVFDTARWLGDALRSVDRQDRRAETEVIVVDDGSTDGSGDVARAYAAGAPGVRVVRQDNAGLGAARNHGMALASGRYLAFLDADDLYADGGLAHLLDRAEQTGALVAVGDMEGMPPRPSPAWRRELVTGERVVSGVGEAPDLVGNPSPCNKVFRRDLVASVGARFTEGTSFEDVNFTLPLLLRSSRTLLEPRLLYRYRTRPDGSSIMDSRGRPDRIMEHLAVVERLAGELDGAAEAERQAVYRWIAYMQLHYAWRAAGALDDAALADFTHRTAALLKHVPVDTAAEFVPNAGAGLRAAGLYEDDPALVRRPRTAAPLLVRAGVVALAHPRFERYAPLLRVRDAAVAFTRVARGFVVEGTARWSGADAVPGRTRPDLLLEVGDALVRRPLVVRTASGGRLEWACALPLGALPAGRHPLRVVVRDAGREATLAGTTRAGSRPVPLGGGRAAWLAAGPVLVLDRRRTAAAAQTARRATAALRRHLR